jgi:AraC-like DNA-binding protein
MRISLYFILLFSTICVFSQNKKSLSNSEYQILQDKARLFINSNIDSSFVYANKIENSNTSSHKTFALGIKSYLYQLKGDSIQSKRLNSKALELLKTITNSKEKIRLNSLLFNFDGLSEWKRGNLNNALDLYFKGKNLSKKINDVVQIIKFNNNISSIYADIGNYNLAISTAKESDRLTDNNSYLYEKEKFNQSKSTVNYKLGTFYEREFIKNKNYIFLDSAEYYYKQTLIYSKNSFINEINSKLNLGSIYKFKKNFENAEKIYLGILKSDKSSISLDNYKDLNVKLGELYYHQNKFKEALICFKKVDSIHDVKPDNNDLFKYSSYFQAKMYNSFDDSKNALKYSKIYLEENKFIESKLSNETIDINFVIGKKSFSKEMKEIESKNSNSILLTQIITFIVISIIISIIGFLIWNLKKKEQANKKAEKLIEEFKSEIRKNKIQNLQKENQNIEVQESIKKTEVVSLNIDEEKENEIFEKLKTLELKNEFLKANFTQTYVAKKIKTNTTYLSYVVNKRFNKSFSEYANELKINYVINQLITNPTYRKYSTQAIAESVGFKKANSFTKSFSKRTGVSPVQFAKKLDSI